MENRMNPMFETENYTIMNTFRTFDNEYSRLQKQIDAIQIDIIDSRIENGEEARMLARRLHDCYQALNMVRSRAEEWLIDFKGDIWYTDIETIKLSSIAPKSAILSVLISNPKCHIKYDTIQNYLDILVAPLRDSEFECSILNRALWKRTIDPVLCDGLIARTGISSTALLEEIINALSVYGGNILTIFIDDYVPIMNRLIDKYGASTRNLFRPIFGDASNDINVRYNAGNCIINALIESRRR